MATFTGTYGKTHADALNTGFSARFGGHLGRPNSTLTTQDVYTMGGGSHMPLDTGIHWDWANPLNILPAIVLLVTLIAVIGLILA